MKLENVLKYRSAWLGVAMLWVVFYHSSHFIPFLSWVKNFGYGGVDICLFASGAGCYYSLSKDDDVRGFAKRRLTRIFPTYWCFLPFWIFYAAAALDIKFTEILGNIFGVQNFTTKGNAFNWYISAILLLYLLAPYFKKLVDKVKSMKMQVLVVCILIAFSIPFWTSFTFIITVTRIPIFYMGMLFARRCKEGATLTYKKIAVYAGTMVLGFASLWAVFTYLKDYRWSHGLYWYPFILIAPGLCVCISCAMKLFDKNKWSSLIQKALSFVGKYSFEIYLVHILIYDSVRYLKDSGALPKIPLVNTLATLSIPFACALLVFLTNLIFKKLPSIMSRD